MKKMNKENKCTEEEDKIVLQKIKHPITKKSNLQDKIYQILREGTKIYKHIIL